MINGMARKRLRGCLEPGGCEENPVGLIMRCVEHLRADDHLACAETYAVACVFYYGHDISAMPDGGFDALCHWLLTEKAWKLVSWLDQEMLKAGSGYDLAKLPAYLREWAETRLDWARGEERSVVDIQQRIRRGEFGRAASPMER